MCVADYTMANRRNNSQIEWGLVIGEGYNGKYPDTIHMDPQEHFNRLSHRKALLSICYHMTSHERRQPRVYPTEVIPREMRLKTCVINPQQLFEYHI